MTQTNVASTTKCLALVLYALCLSDVREAHGFSRSYSCRQRFSASRCRMRMDIESPNHRESKLVRRWKLSSFLSKQNQRSVPLAPKDNDNDESTSEECQHAEIATSFLHGMPWNRSIDTSHTAPYYMPFWNYQMQFMKNNLTNLRTLPVISLETGNDLAYREEKNMRIHTLLLASDEFRLIRLTVVDAGARTQVFTSVWYPDPKYNTPIFGIDLLKFGERKHVCIVDMQPIHDTDDAVDSSFERVEPCLYSHVLQPIRDRYPSLQGRMTSRFYDENSFFSDQMLHIRQDLDPEEADRTIYHELFPAVQSYMQTYVNMHRTAEPKPEKVASVLRRHADYDVYSSERDPAHAFFGKSFGKDFADDYVSNILFPYSKVRSW
mmetsp:Transcript_12667/g.30571  ORF Transcript_12667/g.30571 Transcript_12667/m.30571 type:complete len:378 (-) Transcript_12667:17-1150(-)